MLGGLPLPHTWPTDGGRGGPWALALFLLVGWVSQEPFAAISGPGESRFLAALLTAHWPAHPTCKGRKGHIRAAGFPVPSQALSPGPHRRGEVTSNRLAP